MHEVLVNPLGGLSLPRKSVVRLTDRPDMTLDVYRGHKTTIQHLLSYYPPLFKIETTYDLFLLFLMQKPMKVGVLIQERICSKITKSFH